MAAITGDNRHGRPGGRGLSTPIPGRTDKDVQFVTDVADDSLGPNFSEDLERFYDRANEQDKRRCVELLASLSLSDDLNKKVQRLQSSKHKVSTTNKGRAHQRPKTAMASIGDGRGSYRPGSSRDVKRTDTSYRRDFPPRPAPPATQARPKSTQGFYHAKYKLSGPVGKATYTKQYNDKGHCRPDLIRSGTASGSRRNNPHPFESFMVWRFPKDVPEDQNIYAGGVLTDQMMEEILRDKCQSTYQSDYLGIPQGHQVSSAFDSYRDWRENIPYSLGSTMRFSYQFPRQPEEILKSNTSRFGCNSKQQIPASGIVPTSQRHQMKIRRNTTYDRFFNQPFRPGQVELSKAVKSGKINEYLRLADDKERDVLLRMLANMNAQERSSERSDRSRTPSTAGRPLSANVPKPPPPKNSGVSHWTGPQ